MTNDLNIRVPGSITLTVKLDEASIENLAAAMGTVQEARQVPFSTLQETADPLEDLYWLLEHNVHVTVGMIDDAPYVRPMPTAGITANMYKGDILRALGKLRKELEGALPSKPSS